MAAKSCLDGRAAERLEFQPLAHALLPVTIADDVAAVHGLHHVGRLPQAIEAETDPEGDARRVLAVRALQQRARLVHFAGGAIFHENCFKFEEQGAVLPVQDVTKTHCGKGETHSSRGCSQVLLPVEALK